MWNNPERILRLLKEEAEKRNEDLELAKALGNEPPQALEGDLYAKIIPISVSEISEATQKVFNETFANTDVSIACYKGPVANIQTLVDPSKTADQVAVKAESPANAKLGEGKGKDGQCLEVRNASGDVVMRYAQFGNNRVLCGKADTQKEMIRLLEVHEKLHPNSAHKITIADPNNKERVQMIARAHFIQQSAAGKKESEIKFPWPDTSAAKEAKRAFELEKAELKGHLLTDQPSSEYFKQLSPDLKLMAAAFADQDLRDFAKQQIKEVLTETAVSKAQKDKIAPEPKPEQAQPKPEAATAVKSELEPKSTSLPEPKPEPKVEPKLSEPKPEPRPESSPELKGASPKPEFKSETDKELKDKEESLKKHNVEEEVKTFATPTEAQIEQIETARGANQPPPQETKSDSKLLVKAALTAGLRDVNNDADDYERKLLEQADKNKSSCRSSSSSNYGDDESHESLDKLADRDMSAEDKKVAEESKKAQEQQLKQSQETSEQSNAGLKASGSPQSGSSDSSTSTLTPKLVPPGGKY